MAPSRKLIDRRRAAPRRYEAIRQQLLDDLADGGDIKQLRTADIALIEQAATLIMRAEMMRADILSGNTCDDDKLVRITNAAARVLNTLRSKHTKKPKRSLHDHLASRAAAKMDLSNDQNGDADLDH
jgi:hypothetical protein